MNAEARTRDESIDMVRGLVMVIMALDHTRDFFGGSLGDPTNFATTTVLLFLTRWITHFCAPVFVFLAGTSAFLTGTRRTKPGLARFLLSRGLWLILLEVTIVRVAWSFDVTFHRLTFQVIWVIGASMVVLAGLVFLPIAAIAIFGAVLVAAHDAFDHSNWHSNAWTILHVPGVVQPSAGTRLFFLYPLVPWVGVMALGYAFGAWQQLAPAKRRLRVATTGVVATVAFVILRATNLYGDPAPWTHQSRMAFTVLSFLNCAKYPPSLSYLLMTLGPSLLLLAALDGRSPRWARPFVIFGRVPLFYYVLHLYLLHGAATLIALARHAPPPATRWGRAGFGLLGVYVAWLLAVLVLYPACRWFAGVKSRRRDQWLSYL